MNCNEACDFLVSAQEDRTAAMSRDFDAHVRSCPSCARMVAISEVRRELVGASSDKIVTVPPFFSARVMAAIAEQKAEAETRAFEPWAWIWQMARRMVPAGVGLAVLIAVFTFGFTPSPTPIAITGGKVNGAAINFDVVRTFAGNPVTTKYECTVSGDTMHVKQTIDLGRGAQTVEGDAKRITP